MADNKISDNYDALYNYSVCMKPHLENFVDRMNINKVYLDYEFFKNKCVQEREVLESFKMTIKN